MAAVDTTPSELAALLEEFGRAPGNFPVRLREPRELYEQIETIASWALGKVPEGLSGRAETLRDAAVLFVQRACFAPGNNHYEVLGLTSGPLNAEALRARYRSLIRLTHPDVGVAGLPTTAAGTVNRAYEVLSDDELRLRYDEVLAKRERGGKAPPGGSAVKRIELRSTWGERWQSWVARHPLMVRAGLTLTCMGVVGLILLAWAAVSSQSSTAMIVARSAGAYEGTADAALDKSVRVNSGEAATGVLRMTDGRAQASPPRQDPARSPPPPPSKLAMASDASAKPSTTSGSTSPTSAAPADSQTAPTSNTQLRHLGNMFGWGDQRPPGTETAPASTNTSPAAPRSMPPATVTLATATPTATTTATPGFQPAPARPTAAPTPAPAVASAPPATQVSAARNNGSGGSGGGFPVDTVRAKSYLTDILMSLEKPSNARSTNAYLSEMNVQGSLLQPALQLMRKYPDINIENMSWQDNVRPGVMRVQGSVTITARNGNLAESRKVAFQLNAEFWGLRDGTFLASLNMKEED